MVWIIYTNFFAPKLRTESIYVFVNNILLFIKVVIASCAKIIIPKKSLKCAHGEICIFFVINPLSTTVI